MKKILTGVKPTGDGMHLGNYLGMFKPLLENSNGKESYLMIADYHSLTSVHDRETLIDHKKRMLCEFFALLPEDSHIITFEQSKITHINNITWILSSVTPYSLMLRAHSFKDAENKNSDINMAVFNYPILMASDILTYDIDLVPVGKDQKQHLEFARDIAEDFNKRYNCEFFKLPDAFISEEVGLIPGIDGRKMSKSYNNHIGIFDDEKTMKKKIMSIVTGSEGLEEPKNPDTCNIFALIKFFASKEKQEEIASKYRAGNYGYGHAKLELLEILLDYFKDARIKYNYYLDNYDEVLSKINPGNIRVNEMANLKYREMMKIIGL
ncbi:MAG: tryptophan--tRNA ligase [Candidatus Gracilibacteria bacterium]|nr:tryptophan--tRNA ligase [Candidatus Gracilibacteria bacterium]